ncbi:exodeoxyribonuclease VII small subunit [Fontivita pretiosa]|uniref:exodeoxyribonuclease VII small subunit n=1 Tax=Fontivita pretiosa TaxID=2989684 RepID=UPI003D1777C6
MAKKTQNPPRSFEEALAELEQILAEIESGSVGLEQSLIKYQRGSFLIQHCRAILNRAEKQIELLSKADDGSLAAEAMDDQPPAGNQDDGGQSGDDPGADPGQAQNKAAVNKSR